MSDIFFYEWNYDKGEIIQYERQGECNMCGECCTAHIQFTVSGRRFRTRESDGELYYPADGPTPKSGGETTDGQGIWYEIRRGNLRRFFKDEKIGAVGSNVCSDLTSEMKCAQQRGKTLYNKAWPMNPRQIAAFPSCSYKMIVIERWPITEINGREGGSNG